MTHSQHSNHVQLSGIASWENVKLPTLFFKANLKASAKKIRQIFMKVLQASPTVIKTDFLGLHA